MQKLNNLLKYNFNTLVIFELIYKLSTGFIFIPIFFALFRLITKVSGFTYLTLENVGSFLLNPLVIIFLIILLLLITFYTLIDLSTIIIILDASYQKKKIKLKDALILSFHKASLVFKKENIFLPFLIIFLIPFLNMGISSSVISTVKIPEFIMDFIIHNKMLLILYFIVIILLSIILFRWLYVLHYFILEDCNFKEAREKSKKLSYKNKIKDFLKLKLSVFIIFCLYLLFILLGIFIIIGLYKIFKNIEIIQSLSITLIWLLIALSLIVLLTIMTPINYGVISLLFYEHKIVNKEEIKELKISNKEKKNGYPRLRKLKYIVIILIVVSGSVLTNLVLRNKLNLNIEYIRQIEVTAHRGLSKLYPENTMLAFKEAKKAGADWIELDVQQTKDGQIIVMHDHNLKRTTGLDKNTWELTWEEIEKLDAGSFLNPKFKGEKIPLLKDVLQFALDENINLNIELKPTGKEKDFEKDVAKLIQEYNFYDHCVVTSQVYDVLENIKKANKQIPTIYVMSLAYGDVLSLDQADGYSIEASSINKKIVKDIHNKGKVVYAWTVNSQDSIQKMIDLNVDNIISDDIALAKETIYESKTSDVVRLFIKKVNEWLG